MVTKIGAVVKVKAGMFAGVQGTITGLARGAHGLVAQVLFSLPHNGVASNWTDVNNLELV